MQQTVEDKQIEGDRQNNGAIVLLFNLAICKIYAEIIVSKWLGSGSCVTVSDMAVKIGGGVTDKGDNDAFISELSLLFFQGQFE